MAMTRREALERGLVLGGAGALSALAPAGWLEAWAQAARAARAATPSNEVGPYYKRLAPESTNLRSGDDAGLPLSLSGQVLNVHGEPLREAVIELWHADPLGHYDLEGFRYRARVPLDPAARYALQTSLPGHYPGRVCQHVHYLVKAPGHKALVTQLYFASDPVFEGDLEHNFDRDPLIGSRELVRPVVLSGEAGAPRAEVRFDLVLEAL